MKLKTLVAGFAFGIFFFSSCRDSVKETTIVRETDTETNTEPDTEEKEGILERTAKEVDKEVNKEIDKKIDKIGDDN